MAFFFQNGGFRIGIDSDLETKATPAWIVNVAFEQGSANSWEECWSRAFSVFLFEVWIVVESSG